MGGRKTSGRASEHRSGGNAMPDTGRGATPRVETGRRIHGGRRIGPGANRMGERAEDRRDAYPWA